MTFVAAAGLFTVPPKPTSTPMSVFRAASIVPKSPTASPGWSHRRGHFARSLRAGRLCGLQSKGRRTHRPRCRGRYQRGIDDELRGLSGGNALTIDPRYSFDLTARAGYLVNDKTLVYLRGGYANTRVRATLASDTDVVTTSDNLDGWLVGGGVERALTDDISARLEYRYTDLGSDGGEFDQHQALVGISYNF